MECGKTQPAAQDEALEDSRDVDGQARVPTSEELGAGLVPRNLPCRISIEIRGIEWYIYNRTAAYEAILGKIVNEDLSKNADFNVKNITTSTSKPSSIGNATPGKNVDGRVPTETKGGDSAIRYEDRAEKELEGLDPISTRNTSSSFSGSGGTNQTVELPSVLKILPIHIECNKGAIVMGNQNTRSILVAKFENATGHLGARNARSIDKFKSWIEFDFGHPVVYFKKNQDFKESQNAEGSRHKGNDGIIEVPSKSRYANYAVVQWTHHAWSFFQGVISLFKTRADSASQDRKRMRNVFHTSEDEPSVPGQSRWLGLTRYLDEDDDFAEQERWKAIEYGRIPTILDSPKLAISVYWDIPGLVMMPDNSFSQPHPDASEDINGEAPPDWGVDVRIFGGNIRYGPWADRQRADLQAIFFPTLYKDSVPEKRLKPGDTRVSTFFKLVVQIEEQVTLGIPTREESKDWKWRGRENGQDRANRRSKDKKERSKYKKNEEADAMPETRSCGWLDIKLYPDSTISFTMDLVARSNGFTNRVELDLPGIEISTSVNHGLFLRSTLQRISCDLFYPLKWNELHPWHIDIHAHNPHIFLLRDHIFLLTDLVSDWVSGPPSDFYTFVPFDYTINLQLDHFKLYLNANDSNIINHPADIEDNIFTMLFGKDLSAAVSIPLRNLRPSRNQVLFDVHAVDGGMELFSPLWNTYHTFLDDSKIARMENLRVHGSYDYFTSTKPGLTDILILNLDGSTLRLHLYGFLVRYLMNLKENYFGENLHFRTVEEYQAQHAQQEKSNTGVLDTGLHSRLSNDMDVIMAIAVHEPCIVLPTHIYSASESISLELSSLGLDLRVTNYYMDLAVTLSPISISRSNFFSKEDEVQAEEQSNVQVFIDGLEISSHRLFGLPPAEPTYVCNWDFFVGSITGQCSDEALESLFRILRSFTFTFKDSENALSCVQGQVIHDLTLLRARIRPIKVGLQLQEVAFLFSTDDIKIRYNDSMGELFSGNASISAPKLTTACVLNASISMDEKRWRSAVAPSGYLATTIDIKMIMQMGDLTRNRQLQQSHISQHDGPTHRVPWLIQSPQQPPLPNSSDCPPKYRAPPIPIPPMPEPVLEVYDYTSDYLTTSSKSFLKGTRETAFRRKNSFLSACSARQVRAKQIRPNIASTTRPATLEKPDKNSQVPPSTDQPLAPKGGRFGLASSSLYRKPPFSLLETRLDLSAVPVVLSDMPVDVPGYNIGPRPGKLSSLDEGLERSSYIVCLPNGLQAFCEFESIFEIGALVLQRHKADPVALLDELQVNMTTERPLSSTRTGKGQRVTELRLWVPYMGARMASLRPVQDGVIMQQFHLDLGLERLLITGRSSEPQPRDSDSLASSQSSLHVTLGQASCSASTISEVPPTRKAVIQALVYDTIFWLVSHPALAVKAQFKNLDVMTEATSGDAHASLLQQTLEISQAGSESLSKIKLTKTSSMQSLVLFLSVTGDGITDPPFLTTTSYVLRGAVSHPRTSDSWRIVSRLRYIYQSLPDGLKSQAALHCMEETSTFSEDAPKRVLQSFEKRRTWDVTLVRQSRLMQEVYGLLKSSVDERNFAQLPAKVAFTAGVIRFRMGPQVSANDIIIEQFIFGMTTNQPWQESAVPAAMTHIRHSVLEMHCGKVTMRFNRSLFQYVEAALGFLKTLPPGEPAKAGVIPSVESLRIIHRLHVAVSLKSIVLSLQSINLEAISVVSDLNASVILYPSLAGDGFSHSAIVNSGTVTTKISDKSVHLVFMKVTRPSLFGSMDGHVRHSETSTLKFTGLCADFSLEVLEKPLEILNLTDRLLGEEIVAYIGLMKYFQSASDGKQPLDSPERKASVKTHGFLSVDLYSISFAILPSLTYLISGHGLQILLLPGKAMKSGLVMEFDMKKHSHLMRKHLRDRPDNISTLDIPPVYGRVDLRQGTNQNIGVFHGTVEVINLDASSVHAFLDALGHREITSLLTKFTQEVALLQRHWQKQFPTTSEQVTPQHDREPTIFTGHVSLAGLVIRTNILKSPISAEGAQLQLQMGLIELRATNRSRDFGGVLQIPDFDVTFSSIKTELFQFKNSQPDPSGSFSIGVDLKSMSEMNSRNESIRTYEVLTHDLTVHIYSDTASILLQIISHLQDTVKKIDVAKEVRGLRRLTRARLQSEAFAPKHNKVDNQNADDILSLATLNAMYSLKMMQTNVVWKTGAHTPGRVVEDLVLSFTKIDFASKKEKAARLLIENFQLQVVPSSGVPPGRSLNSALLPELVFNVAYVSTTTDRRFAFQAAGKSLDLCLTSDFILPASDLRHSIAIAVADVRKAIMSWNTPTAEGSSPRKRPLGKKRLASVLIDADFAGAMVHIQGRRDPGRSSSALGRRPGEPVPQHGRYAHFTQDHASRSTTLRAPGIALKFEYKHLGDNQPSLSAEFKVDASSNVLYPTVVPLIMEISSSIKEVVGESGNQAESGAVTPESPKLVDQGLPAEGSNTIFGTCRLNLGLRICRQEFSLSCQPIARVAATAHFETIYITLSTMHSADEEQSFTLSATVNQLQASIQHDYSRESTGSFEIDSIFLSMMSSKHAGVGNGLSAILKSSPIKALINAKQSHDFLLFREIWVPQEIRHTPPTVTKPTSESQAFMVQHYQQVAAAGTFPWDATVSIAMVDIQLDLGQSLGRSTLVISDIWVSSKKSSDWEQNLCLGFLKGSVHSTGRMSGFIELQKFAVRTSIHWTPVAQKQSRAPLIQASLGFDRLRVKAAFDFEAFLIADLTAFKFLMYNVRDGRQTLGDHLVGVVEGEKVQVFCTSTSASQGLALYQAWERLVQEKRVAYETSLKGIEKYLRRTPSTDPSAPGVASKVERKKTEKTLTALLQLQANVFVQLGAISLGAFPSTFFDNQIFKVEALDASARFGAVLENDKLHSILGMTLGQLRVALSAVLRTTGPKAVGEMLVEETVASAAESRGGTILKVPRVVATMQTWQASQSNHIEYLFGSTFQGKVDVGWNYSRISFLRGMWAAHTRALAHRWGKPLPPSALQITGGLQPDGESGENPRKGSAPAKITAVVNVPQSKFHYTALQPPVIETPQLRDMGEATPPLEWIGLHRERLPTLTHQIVIVSLLEVAKEVEDAYQRILGSF